MHDRSKVHLRSLGGYRKVKLHSFVYIALTLLSCDFSMLSVLSELGYGIPPLSSAFLLISLRYPPVVSPTPASDHLCNFQAHSSFFFFQCLIVCILRSTCFCCDHLCYLLIILVLHNLAHPDCILPALPFLSYSSLVLL